MNSGANFLRAASTAVHSTFTSRPSIGLSFGWMKPIPPCINSVISALPRFEVMKITVCERSTRRLSPSVNVALSSMPRRSCQRASLAFSISSNSRKLSFSVSVWCAASASWMISGCVSRWPRYPGGEPISFEISKLIGSPPGYLGHRETHPLIIQEALAAHHTDTLKLSFLLFDEIEKASDALWQLLLGMLDRATLTLGDNRRVDLSQTVIFMTSNLGSAEITELMHGGMGFIQPKDKPMEGLDVKVECTAVEAARRKFAPEFMNRLDKIVVFHPLNREQLTEVLQIELVQLQQRILQTRNGQFLFRVTDAGREFLLYEGTDQRYGARHLKRAIERHVVFPLANLLATGQVQASDI